ncbi:MAG TPA: oligoendopeptidase F [Planctomycetes bacterium]|nr:oligoendopeptidase F [Planctomycetaceae bacterium]HIM29328.1 oligoendopeptidase F [Planctomycetota bacterium]
MSTSVKLPRRDEVEVENTWDLASLFRDDKAWSADLAVLKEKIEGYAQFQGKLADSAKSLADCLSFDVEVDRLADRLGVYAYLKSTEDQTDSAYQEMMGRYQHLATDASQKASFIRPELMAISDEQMEQMTSDEALAPYRLLLERILRYKRHTLTTNEERLLAMQGEMAQTASQAFRQLHDADLKFGTVVDEQGRQVDLSHATLSQLLESPSREVRSTAFHQYYVQFTDHEHVLAATLNGSIQGDVYYARARGYEGCLQQALFADNVPLSVYDGLIDAVRANLPALHKYYDLRRRKMGLEEIHHYDTYVPILADRRQQRKWNVAVEQIIESLQPLGEEYTRVLESGLRSRWCDRYPNQGKQSGAFSYGVYDSDPFIMINYKEDVLDDVFTLAHEAGHSMHTYLSAKTQPYVYYNYTIFVAEVASTFNEQLLSKHLMAQAESEQERAYLINRELDNIRGTIFRQTMFAEFEKITHAMIEQGEPLTVATFKDVYGELLDAYFGPDFAIDDELPLECFRIPHFYRSFYVYKYATGMSAAIALSQRVLDGGETELADYLNFLGSGCSKYPLDLLRGAGVDMEKPDAVATALQRFDRLVDELDQLLPEAVTS